MFIRKLCPILVLIASSMLLVAEEVQDAQDESSQNAYTFEPSEVLAQAYIPDSTRPIIAGDVLRFQVFEDEEPPVYIKVNDQGFIDFPYLGRRKVEGRTCQEIVEELTVELEKTYYYEASVFLAVEQENPIRGRVYVVGEVGSQGAQGIPSSIEFTLSKAILAAGGFTKYAKKNRVRVIRDLPDGGQKTFEVNVDEIFETGDRSSDVILEPNDFIIVPKSVISFN